MDRDLIDINYKTENYTHVECVKLARLFYWYDTVWIAILARILMSNYMSLRQSRPIDECNEEFVCVFNTSVDEMSSARSEAEKLLAEQTEDALNEKIEREKFSRRQRFYREYADNQLARIIMSLCDVENRQNVVTSEQILTSRDELTSQAISIDQE